MEGKAMSPAALIRSRSEATPPHGEVIRIDVRRLAGVEPRSAVLVVHGFKGFKDWGFFPHLCESLAADGHLVVSFNGSRNGIGPNLLDFTDLEAFGRNTISHEVADLHWMLDRMCAGAWSGGRRPESVGLLGHSRGGGTSIVTAAERDDISALVTWAAVSTFHRWTRQQREEWARDGVTYVANARTGQDMPLDRIVQEDVEANRSRFDVLAAAARVTVPWLVVHGEDDATVHASEARALAEAGPNTELEVLRGSGHTFEAAHPFEGVTPGLDAAIDATRQRFRPLLRCDGVATRGELRNDETP